MHTFRACRVAPLANYTYLAGGMKVKAETGFGSRHLSPALRSWMVPDPMSEKYYGLSPYSYCGGNPVMFVDPDGEIITITDVYSGESITYSIGEKYSGENTFIQTIVDALDAIAEFGGKEAMSFLISQDSNTYDINSSSVSDNYMTFIETETGGSIPAGIIMPPSFEQSIIVDKLSHELFHGVQAASGQGGTSITNEIEAMAFSSIVYKNYYKANIGKMILQEGNYHKWRNNEDGLCYMVGFGSITLGKPYVKSAMPLAVNHFKKGSEVNRGGQYDIL